MKKENGNGSANDLVVPDPKEVITTAHVIQEDEPQNLHASVAAFRSQFKVIKETVGMIGIPMQVQNNSALQMGPQIVIQSKLWCYIEFEATREQVQELRSKVKLQM